MVKKTKSVAKSVRMTEDVANYIQQFEGDGFNQKLENLVLFCMESEAARVMKLEDLDCRQIAERRKELWEQLHKIDTALRASVRASAELQAYLDFATGVKSLPGDAKQ